MRCSASVLLLNIYVPMWERCQYVCYGASALVTSSRLCSLSNMRMVRLRLVHLGLLVISTFMLPQQTFQP